MALQVATYEQILTILAQLAENYTNFYDTYFTMFYDNVPADVVLKVYDDQGQQQTITLPNRAKDMAHILNGEGDPNNVVSAGKGSIYQDLGNGVVYLNVDGTDSGWVKLVSKTALDEIIMQGGTSPEGAVTASKGILYSDTQNGVLYIKTTETGNVGWINVSADLDGVADIDLSNLSPEGERHFANLSLNNLNSEGEAKFNRKENVSNKVTEVTINSTDVQYPSAKAVYKLGNDLDLNKANIDLNNLSVAGQAKLDEKASVDLNNLSYEGQNIIDNKTNIYLSNLSEEGRNVLEFAPFAINQGTIINGENHTLQVESFITAYPEPGTYIVEITEAGNYLIEMYGAGGGWANGGWATDTFYHQTSGGGSGAGFKGVLTLPVGSYTVVVGAGGSNLNQTPGGGRANAGGATTFGSLITANGGGGGYSPYLSTPTGGAGGALTISQSAQVVSTTLNSSGRSGSIAGGAYSMAPSTVEGGRSLYDNSLAGYGAGGGYPYNSVNGFFKITKLTGDAKYLSCDTCTITTADGRTKVFEEAINTDVSSMANGNYTIFKNFEDGALTFALSSTFSIGKTGSTYYWLDSSTVPANLYVNGEINNDLVFIGTCVISNGIATNVVNRTINDSGYVVEKAVLSAIRPVLSAAVALSGIDTTNKNFTAPSDGYVSAHIQASNSATTFYIDDRPVGYIVSNATNDVWTPMYMVSKGVHTFKYAAASASLILAVQFYPMKGNT